MEYDIDYGKDINIEDLGDFEEVNIKFDKNAGNLFTLHFIKLKCLKCNEKYLDLDNAKKYDLLLILGRAFKQSLDVLSKKVEKLV